MNRRKGKTGDDEAREHVSKHQGRHPLFGCLHGMITVAAEADPMVPSWLEEADGRHRTSAGEQ